MNLIDVYLCIHVVYHQVWQKFMGHPRFVVDLSVNMPFLFRIIKFQFTTNSSIFKPESLLDVPRFVRHLRKGKWPTSSCTYWCILWCI